MYKIIGADQKEYGPINADQLRQWIAEGRVNNATRILAEGETVWKTVGELPEFAPIVAPAASAPPTGIFPQGAPIVMPGHVPQRTNQMALWSMITGIFSVLCCCYVIGPLPIVLGVVAQSQLKNNPRESGHGFAITGIVLGIISVLLGITGTLIYIFSPQQPLPMDWQNLFKH